MEIWSNESQERYVLAIKKSNKDIFENICRRERCPVAFVGQTTSKDTVEVYDPERDEFPVHVPLSMLFGDLPISNMKLNDPKIKQVINSIRNDLDLSEVIHRVLSHPSVASKSFLITIGDRTVGGLVARDQLVGRYQVPTSNYAMATKSFLSNEGRCFINRGKAYSRNSKSSSLHEDGLSRSTNEPSFCPSQKFRPSETLCKLDGSMWRRGR